MFELTRVEPAVVMAAIEAGTGIFLRERFEAEARVVSQAIDRRAPMFYPSVKDSFGMSAREASTIHDMSTLLMPEFHEAANIAHHLNRLSRQLATDDTVFCISQATRAAILVAFPSVERKIKLLYQYADWPERFAIM